jgi:putative oxidoreductase
MKIPTLHPWFFLTLRLILGGLFVCAGVLKMKDPQAFSDSIASFQIMPERLINPLAIGLPPFEILLGAWLMVGRACRPAALGLLLLSSVFAAALLQALIRGLHVDCGCFGGGAPSVVKNWVSFGRDIILALVALWLCLRFHQLDSASARRGQEPIESRNQPAPVA